MSLYFTQPDAAWQHVIELAIARNTQVELLIDNGDAQRIWRASSFSRPGHWHILDVDASVNGIRFDCECFAHQDGSKPCSHAAAMFLAMGLLTAPAPAPEPVDAPAEPSPDVVRLRGKVALSLLSGDDDYDALLGEYDAIKNEMGQ